MGRNANLLDYFNLIIMWRKLIFINFFVVCFLAAGLSLVLPRSYKSFTTILPPAGDESGFGLSSILDNLPLNGLGLGNVSEETYTLLAILNSRTVMESAVNRFDLISRYKAKNIEEAVKSLREDIYIDVNEEGTITLSAQASTRWFYKKSMDDEARQFAKAMADYFIHELDQVNKRLKTERATNSRIFIEKRYMENIKDLSLAEEEFKVFQEEYGAIAIQEQTRVTIMAVSDIKAQIVSHEIERDVLLDMFGRSHNGVLRLERELISLQNKYEEFIKGNSDWDTRQEHGGTPDFILSLEEIPDLGLQYARFYREVVLQEKIMEFLLPQYEQAKIQEAKDTPTVQVLDIANLPLKRAKPKRAFFVMFWGLLSLLFSLGAILIIEYFNDLKINDPEKYRRLNQSYQALRSDLSVFRKHN